MDPLNPYGQNNVAPALSDTEYGIPETILCELNYQDKIICTIDRTQEKSAMDFKNLTLFSNNNKTYVCYAKDRLLNPINITSGVCVMTWKTSKSGDVVLTKRTDVSGEGEIGAGNKGEFYFYILPEDTEELDERQYFFDINILISSKIYTVAEGVINLKNV